MAAVEVAHVAAAQRLHRQAQRARIGRRRQQMELVRHQRVGVDRHLVPAAQAAQLAEHELVVGVGQKGRLARDAALNEQVRVPWNGETGEACHGAAVLLETSETVDVPLPPVASSADREKAAVLRDRVSIGHSGNVVGDRAGPVRRRARLVVRRKQSGLLMKCLEQLAHDSSGFGRHPHHLPRRHRHRQRHHAPRAPTLREGFAQARRRLPQTAASRR